MAEVTGFLTRLSPQAASGGRTCARPRGCSNGHSDARLRHLNNCLQMTAGTP
jgi:hypothetical protein